MDTEPTSRVGRCFAAKIAAWFERQHAGAHGSPRSVEALVWARQTNMALALAVSKWLEYESLEDEPLARMRDWIAQTLARAEARRADARADAMRRAAAWLDDCAREGL